MHFASRGKPKRSTDKATILQQVLLPGESSKEYEIFQRRTIQSIKPQDFLEEIWVSDFVELTWEIYRLRSFKGSIITSSFPQSFHEKTVGSIGSERADQIRRDFHLGEGQPLREAEVVLSRMKLTPADVNAMALTRRFDIVDKIGSMILQAMGRRDASLREMYRRRETLASRLKAVADIEDVDFSEVGGATVTSLPPPRRGPLNG